MSSPARDPFEVFDVGCTISRFLPLMDLLRLARVSQSALMAADDDEVWLERLRNEFGVPLTVRFPETKSIVSGFPTRTFKFAYRNEWRQGRRGGLRALRQIREVRTIFGFGWNHGNMKNWRKAVEKYPELCEVLDEEEQSMLNACAADAIRQQLKTSAIACGSIAVAYAAKRYLAGAASLTQPLSLISGLGGELVSLMSAGTKPTQFLSTPWPYLGAAGACLVAGYQRYAVSRYGKPRRGRTTTTSPAVGDAHLQQIALTRRQKLIAHLNYLIKSVNDTLLIHVAFPMLLELILRGSDAFDTLLAPLSAIVATWLGRIIGIAVCAMLLLLRRSFAAFLIVPLFYVTQFTAVGQGIMAFGMKNLVSLPLLTLVFLYGGRRMTLLCALIYSRLMFPTSANGWLMDALSIPASLARIFLGTESTLPTTSTLTASSALFDAATVATVYGFSCIFLAGSKIRAGALVYGGRFALSRLTSLTFDLVLQNCFLTEGLVPTLFVRIATAMAFVGLVSLKQ